MTNTRALTVTGPDEMSVQEAQVAEPREGEQQIDVAAIGVNFIDVYQRQGVYPVPTPFVLCSEGAGTTRDGQRVAWPQHLGSGAGVVNIRGDKLVAVPDGVELETAAAVMLQGLTAHYLVASTFPIKEGDIALVHAAAGGVGQLLVQMITARGGRVIATAGTGAKRQKALDLGAEVALDYTADIDLAQAVREATGGRGVDVAYDGVGKSTFEASLASLRPRGMLVLFGGASGQVPPFDLQRLNKAGSIFVTRPTLLHYLQDRAELEWRADEVLGAVADGSLSVEVGGRYALTDAAQAYADLEGRHTTGKLILIP